MSAPTLPPLPEPYGILHDGNGNNPLTFARAPWDERLTLVASSMQVFSYAQVRDYATAAVMAERERAARICEGVNDYDGTANDCAAAIREGVK